jgi:hypothetical protein
VTQPTEVAAATAVGSSEFGAGTADSALGGGPYPAAIAVIAGAGAQQLLVADNLSDDALFMDAATGKLITRFDLSESDAVPGTYPVALVVALSVRSVRCVRWDLASSEECRTSQRKSRRGAYRSIQR